MVDAGPMTTDKILFRCFLPDEKGCGADAGNRRPDGTVKVLASLIPRVLRFGQKQKIYQIESSLSGDFLPNQTVFPGLLKFAH